MLCTAARGHVLQVVVCVLKAYCINSAPTASTVRLVCHGVSPHVLLTFRCRRGFPLRSASFTARMIVAIVAAVGARACVLATSGLPADARIPTSVPLATTFALEYVSAPSGVTRGAVHVAGEGVVVLPIADGMFWRDCCTHIQVLHAAGDRSLRGDTLWQ